MVEQIGSGLSVDHEYSEAIAARAVREGPGRWRAEISGVTKGAIVRVWQSAGVHATREAAVQEAQEVHAKTNNNPQASGEER